MNPGMARYTSRFQYIDSSAAIADLDYSISTPDEIIGDAIDWYKANGYDL